jgi:acetylornithine/succinyldiaminopimelate/putrescine aminotransferase
MLEIERAEGIYMYSPDGKRYTDLVSGVSVSNLGHRHPDVVRAVKDQLDRYMHLMVYGEMIQTPQVRLAGRLAEILPPELDCTYLVNSGSEAIEGAIKLAKRFTGRYRMIAFQNAYHGGTAGAMSIMGAGPLKNAFRPLPPGVRMLNYNDFDGIDQITEDVACVIMEPVQGEAGIILPENGYLGEIRRRCDATGSILVFDEVQTGMGRTGSMFEFEQTGVVPDILVLAKGFGGGMPLGAFISSREIMSHLTRDPALGHITTFGGHPVSCSAALATLEILLEGKWYEGAEGKGNVFREHLHHPAIREIRGKGLYLGVDLESAEKTAGFIRKALAAGIVSDGFLFRHNAFRISPPLIITEKQIIETCHTINRVLDNC